MVGSQLQSREAVSSGTSRAGALDDPPSTASAIGVPQERVDSRILLIIERLFPGHHGLDFLARLLRCAREKQLALPGIDQAEVSNVAVVSAQSLRVLAKQLGLSYDTTEKYIVVFCQLHLLQKLRQRRQITLHFPLSCPKLPEPEALDHLLECRPGKDIPRYRPKVRSFAEGVKRRFVLFQEQGQIAVAHREKKGDSSGHLPNNIPQLLLEDIRQVIGQEVDSETGKRLLLKVEGVIRSRCRLETSLLSAPKGDSERTNEKDIDQVYTKKSPSGKQKGDSLSKGTTPQSLLSVQNGDSFPHSTSQEGKLLAQNGNSDAQKGDSERSTSVEATSNVNVILRNKLNLLNVNVDEVATYLCILFDQGLKKKKGFYKNLRDTQGCREVDTWLAALIETTQGIQTGLKKPGGFFYRRCVELHKEGIPTHLQKLVQQYGQLSYAQLLEKLQQPKAPGLVSSSSGSRSSRPRSPANDIKLAIPRFPKDRPGMSLEDYMALRKQVKGPGREQMRIDLPYRQNDGSVVALLEDFLGEQRWICSLEEWKQCSQAIHYSIWDWKQKQPIRGKKKEE